MHPKVAGAIQEIDAALFNGDTFDDADDRAELTAYVEKWAKELRTADDKMPEALDVHKADGWKALSKANADFISAQFRRPSALSSVLVREVGSWKDVTGVVHAVNATWIEPDIDLGRETACSSVSWDSDGPGDYPVMNDEAVDCMTCVVHQARTCP